MKIKTDESKAEKAAQDLALAGRSRGNPNCEWTWQHAEDLVHLIFSRASGIGAGRRFW